MLILLSEVIISDHQRLYNIKIIFECDIVEGYSEGEKKKKTYFGTISKNIAELDN